jgi:hypothetical protein
MGQMYLELLLALETFHQLLVLALVLPAPD